MVPDFAFALANPRSKTLYVFSSASIFCFLENVRGYLQLFMWKTLQAWIHLVISPPLVVRDALPAERIDNSFIHSLTARALTSITVSSPELPYLDTTKSMVSSTCYTMAASAIRVTCTECGSG